MSRCYEVVPDYVLLLKRDELVANFGNGTSLFYVTRDRMNRLLREVYERRETKHWASLVFRPSVPGDDETVYNMCVITDWIQNPLGDHRICFRDRREGMELFGEVNNVMRMAFSIDGQPSFVLSTPPVRHRPSPDGQAPFLDAIRANPEDDTAKLVFADWLDENKEPLRAEFIRGTAPSAPASRLPRVRELLDRHANSIIGPATVRSGQHYQTESAVGPHWHCGWLDTLVLGDWHRVEGTDGSIQVGTCRDLKLVLRLGVEQPSVRHVLLNYEPDFMPIPVLKAVYESGMRSVRTVHLRRCRAREGDGPMNPPPLLASQLIRFRSLEEVHCTPAMARHLRDALGAMRLDLDARRVRVIGHEAYR